MAEVVTDFDPDLWASYYRQPRTFGKAIWLRESKTAGPLRELAIFSRYLRRLARQISRGKITAEDLQNELDDFSQQPEQWHELQENALEIREDFHQELNSFLNSMEDDTIEPEPDTLNLFAVTVWIPYMCLCGHSPDKLFQEAAAGDFESLCTLFAWIERLNTSPKFHSTLRSGSVYVTSTE